MSAVEVAICHMHSDHLQSEAIGSMWAAEEVGKFTIEYYPVLFSYMLDKHVMAGPLGKACMDHALPPTCLAHSGTPLSKFERTNNEKYLLHTHMHTVSAS
eukprot:jgi/Botrbrau1/7754/Bobra.0159s0183.1